ncbi:MAG: hypothetical protein ACI4MS_06510, partial [Candidatus Coproplasma sp.]
GNVLDVGASCYEYLYQQIGGELFTANSADVTISLKGHFNYDSNSTIKYEGDSDIYNLALISENGTRSTGEISYETDELELTEVENISAIKIHFGRAVDTLSYGYLTIITDTYTDLNYTTPLDDLKKDTSFNLLDYPYVEDDYSIQVIQIAETTDGELIIYTYQPSADTKNIKAVSINIATKPNVEGVDEETAEELELDFSNYELKLLSSSNVFYKYKVQGFVLSEDETRYYNISNILRPFNETIDDEPGADNTISEMPNKVGQLWTVRSQNGTITYEMVFSETITIENKIVGFKRYSNGWNLLYTSKCDGHFVAFSTDRQIDKLMSAKITYTTSEYTKRTNFTTEKETTTISDPVKVEDTITSDDIGKNNGNWLHKYSWNRIETLDDFLADEVNNGYTITSEEGAEKLLNCQWVLRFLETEYSMIYTESLVSVVLTEQKTYVNDVMILELEFETDGKTYKLGAVDNKQTGSREPLIAESKNYFWVYSIIIILTLSATYFIFIGIKKAKG